MDIRPISVVEQLPRVTELLREHWDEVALNKALMQLNPNAALYARIEAVDMLIAFGAFEAGELIGYAVTFVTAHAHYADLLVAQNDVLFVRKDHRGTAGLRLMRATEREAARRGCGMVTWHAKPGTQLDVMLDRLPAYGVQDIVYSRVLAQRTTQSDKEAGA